MPCSHVRPKRRADVMPSVTSIPYEKLQGYADDWLLECRLRGYSKHTLHGYKACLSVLVRHYNAIKSPVDGKSLAQFLTQENRQTLKPNSAWDYFTRYKTFFAYLVNEKALTASPMAGMKPPIVRQSQIETFSKVQVAALLHAASQTTQARRDTAFVYLLLDSGMRLSEAASLVGKDISITGTQTSVRVLGKGNKERTVYVGVKATRALLAWTKEAKHKPDEPFFFAWHSRDGRKAIQAGSLHRMIERLGKTAGITNVRVSAHTFRHYFAINFLRNGGNLFALQQLMGHTDVKMTRRYVALAEADIETQHRKFSPGDSL